MLEIITKYKFLIIGLLVGILGLTSYLIYDRFFSSQIFWKQTDGSAVVSPAKVYQYFSQLDGLGRDNKEDVAPPIVGVMIDNHPDARPQMGLTKAPIVYEVPVEGGITRYFAIFPGHNLVVEKVGPVRSARPYFLDWLREYGNALYMHSGGSPDALNLIKQLDIFDANEFFWGSYYERTADHDAPHNLYTNSINWGKIIDKYGDKQIGWEGWKFDEAKIASGTQSVQAITIKYVPEYKVAWKYNESSSTYYRFINENESNDALGERLSAKNIIVQYVGISSLDEVDRKKIITIGEGEARVLRDGIMIRASWKKSGASSRTRYFDEGGQEISLKPGNTWVQIVPKNSEIEVSN